jgi:hypothetical protein
MSAYGGFCQPGPGAGAILYKAWTTHSPRRRAQERVLANPAGAPHLWAIFSDCTLGSDGQGNHAENEPFTVNGGREEGRR